MRLLEPGPGALEVAAVKEQGTVVLVDGRNVFLNAQIHPSHERLVVLRVGHDAQGGDTHTHDVADQPVARFQRVSLLVVPSGQQQAVALGRRTEHAPPRHVVGAAQVQQRRHRQAPRQRILEQTDGTRPIGRVQMDHPEVVDGTRMPRTRRAFVVGDRLVDIDVPAQPQVIGLAEQERGFCTGRIRQ
jgi:hypothetical protein